MNFTEAQIELIRSGINERESLGRSRIRGLYRIEIEVTDGLAYRAHETSEAGLEMKVGEPASRGGHGEGASPLAHFLTGLGTCLLNQFVRVAVAEGYEIDFRTARVRAEFGREVGGGFERIASRVDAEGRLTEVDAGRLVHRAEALCYVHATLRKAVAMTTILAVNGIEVAASETRPGDG